MLLCRGIRQTVHGPALGLRCGTQCVEIMLPGRGHGVQILGYVKQDRRVRSQNGVGEVVALCVDHLKIEDELLVTVLDFDFSGMFPISFGVGRGEQRIAKELGITPVRLHDNCI